MGADRDRSAFRATAESFGPISASERARIREARLRIVTARAGEMLGDVLSRTNATWSIEMGAAANALETTGPLHSGQLVKVPVMHSYSGRGPQNLG